MLVAAPNPFAIYGHKLIFQTEQLLDTIEFFTERDTSLGVHNEKGGEKEGASKQ